MGIFSKKLKLSIFLYSNFLHICQIAPLDISGGLNKETFSKQELEKIGNELTGMIIAQFYLMAIYLAKTGQIKGINPEQYEIISSAIEPIIRQGFVDRGLSETEANKRYNEVFEFLNMYIGHVEALPGMDDLSNSYAEALKFAVNRLGFKTKSQQRKYEAVYDLASRTNDALPRAWKQHISNYQLVNDLG